MSAVRVRLFASAREAAGTAADTVEAATVGDALAILCDRYGADFAAVLQTARVWVNGDEPDGDGAPLDDGDELAVLPPVSGGCGRSTPGRGEARRRRAPRTAADSLAP